MFQRDILPPFLNRYDENEWKADYIRNGGRTSDCAEIFHDREVDAAKFGAQPKYCSMQQPTRQHHILYNKFIIRIRVKYSYVIYFLCTR